MAKMYWWKSLTVTYQFHNLFGEILFLIEAVNWISGSYEHNKSDFFSADLTTDRIPRHCTISPSSFTQPSLGSSFTSKLGDCLTAFSSAPSHQGWSQACPKGHQLVEVGAQAPRGPPRLLWFLMISPIFIFPVCSSRNSPSSLHERFPSSKDVSDISTTRNPCSFPFWERLLLWCRRGFLSSGTLVLQHPDLSRTKDRISCLLPPDFLLLLSSFFCLKDGPLNLLLQHLDQVWMDRWMKKVAPLIFRYAPTGT